MFRRGLSLGISVIVALGALLLLRAWAEAAAPRAPAARPAVLYPVNSPLDEPDSNAGDGVCDSTPSHLCTLRAAVQELNAQAAGGTIVLPAGTYAVSDEVDGDINITTSLVLSGAGPSLSLIQGKPTGWAHRIFRVQNGANPLIMGVTISGGHPVGAVGGAIDVVSGTLVLSDSAVSHSSGTTGGGVYANSLITLVNTTLISNVATSGGGGGLFGGSGFTLTGTQFLSNTAFNGNGGGAWATSNATVSGAYFAYNTVITGGNSGGLDTAGSLIAANSTFFDNRNLTRAGGGSGAGGNITLNNVTYISNSANTGGGGALSFGSANILNSQFLSNTTYGYGGALYVNFAAAVTGTTFTSNTSNFGGGGGLVVFVDRCSLLDDNFVRNVTIGMGGGADCGGPSLFISGSHFVSNTASFVGGGAFGYTTTVTNSTFTGNTGAAYAGGLQTYGPTAISGSLFQLNQTQGNGGGVSSFSPVSVSNSTFLSNTAQGDGINGGGAISANGTISATHSTFTANTANTSPGGALISGQNLYLDYATFTGNAAPAGDGGAAVARAGATLDHATFTGNQGLTGGALAVTGTLQVSNTVVTGNFANSGGGLYQYAGDGRIVNSLFAANTASSGAGMQLYLAPTGALQILFTTVGAPSLVSGDAIRLASGTVTIRDTIVTNHAIGLNHQGGTASQDYDLLFGNTQDKFGVVSGGANNASGNPLFANPAGQNYHLLAHSPAIDAGLDLGVHTDFDDQARPFGSRVDIGYDEFSLNELFLPLLRR